MNKISKILSLLLSLLIVFSSFGICAFAAGESYLTFVDGGDFYQLSRCNQYAMGEINIPASYSGKPVTMIASNAFKDCERISKVTIPASVTSVGSSAFENCASLGTVVFESENCTIGTAAFRYCSTLKSITLPSGLKAIPIEAFAGCTALSSISIPSTVTTINKEAFKLCSSLQSVTIPASVTSIGTNVFLNCAKINEFKVQAGNTAYKAISSCLYDYSGKTLIQYPNGKATTGFTVPAGTETIADSAFGSNSVLTSVTLPSGLKTLKAYSFNKCTALSSVVIPDSVTYIGSQAFGGCTSLKSITIPKNVETYSGAFYNSGIETVVIANGVKKIDEKAFEKCASLKNVSIPSSVTEISMGAFDGCTSLESLTISENVKKIGLNAFVNCPKLTLNVVRGSAAHTYAVSNNIPCNVTEPAERKIVGMTIQKFPDKMNYYYKESLETSGMTLLVEYSDGTSETVTSGYTVPATTFKTTGTHKITVTYQGFTDDFTVSVTYAWWQILIRILLLGFLWY